MTERAFTGARYLAGAATVGNDQQQSRGFIDMITEWTWNDGWILMAIHMAQAEQGAGLNGIIAAADATNHTMPSAEEISSALTKFIRHSLVEISNGEYSISAAYRSQIEKAYGTQGGLFTTADKGLKWLAGASLVPTNEESIFITEEELHEACKQYGARCKSR
jgi:hypothetical protein